MLFNSHRGAQKSRKVLMLAFLAMVLLVTWAAFAYVDEVTRAQGKVIASSRTQVIQSVDGGVVKELLVHEGDKIKQGQLLVKLDDSKAAASVEDATAKVAALRSAAVRLRTELQGRPLEFDDDLRAYPAFIANQRELYQRRKENLEASVRTLSNNVGLSREELEMNEPLLKSGDIGKSEILRLRRQVSDLEGQLAATRAKFKQDAQAELTKVEEDLATARQALADRRTMLERTQLVSPSDGVINLITQTTLGAVIRPGDEIMQILPTGDKLIVEAKLRSSDIGFVRAGLPTVVKLDAFDYSVYGVLDGEVSYVSSDALTERTPQGEQIYYRMQVRITQARFKGLQSKLVEIQPGMTCTVEVKTGQHSILKYFVKPLIKTFSDSLSER